MRVSSSVTSLSWIPSEAVTGPMKLSFATGLSHYDPPPPAQLADLDQLRDDDAFRFANVLSAWAEFDEPARRVATGRTAAWCWVDDRPPRPAGRDVRRGADARPASVRPKSATGWITFTQTDRRTDGAAVAAPDQAGAVRAAAVAAGVDDAAADPARGRAIELRACRRQPVPAALGLRRIGRADAQGGGRRVEQVARAAGVDGDAVGRRGLAGRRRRRPRARSSASCRAC